MTIEEEIKKNKKSIIKVCATAAIIYYLANKYKIVHRDQFENVCNLLANLQNRGYIKLLEGGKYIQIVEGLVPPSV